MTMHWQYREHHSPNRGLPSQATKMSVVVVPLASQKPLSWVFEYKEWHGKPG